MKVAGYWPPSLKLRRLKVAGYWFRITSNKQLVSSNKFNFSVAMKKSFLIIFLIPMLFSCSQNGNKVTENSIRKGVMDLTIKYAAGKFKESKETVAADGVVTVADNQVNFVSKSISQLKYIIDPINIKVGLIDDDANEDAIITIFGMNGQDLQTLEHLIIIKSDGKFILSRVIESNMKVIGIKDRVITAEVSSRSLNNPLRDCHECKEVVRYKFKSGDLVRVE